MPKNQNKPKAKKYRRDRNHAEFLDNIEFFSIILKNQIILVYDPPAKRMGLCRQKLNVRETVLSLKLNNSLTSTSIGVDESLST